MPYVYNLIWNFAYALYTAWSVFQSSLFYLSSVANLKHAFKEIPGTHDFRNHGLGNSVDPHPTETNVN